MQTESINLDEIDIFEDSAEGAVLETASYSAIIQCGRLMARKAKTGNNLLPSGKEEIAVIEELTLLQKNYIDFIAFGRSSIDACMELNIDPFLPILWEESADKDSVYMQCLNLIKRKQADNLEDVVWKEAIKNPKSTILKMFALKARKDEYKDNAMPQTNLQTNIQVTISDRYGNVTPYVVDTSMSSTEDISDG